ncbi:TetR/AcrR family transcriptional regulator [Dactylosporangium aurantiacum]|uniref:TetR/AcrR family transcriptional regulator n=1 Tax=Dactylosporangium aurantiacum TaxID=35754 RepID=A0A9Q9IQP6_9ACTN|nr:TetR/AcrR family transcriptional regulator [Dactylosporangium aurantiacum]MDG6103088.1 TetR/AcrR family transcriptional regulator [Dactylosporangium aurantiacum]UWZ57600.1 TetR/AcrR family transcriptional regulator [Dactylosporangium aurantiacum]
MDDLNSTRRRPGRPRAADAVATREVILRVATDLFARNGFDAVTVRAVADAAGVDVATVHHHAGGKLELYRACFALVFEAERRALEPVIAAASAGDGDLLDALHRVLDAFVDFLEERPETTGLWLRRWLEPDRHAGIDEQFSMPLYEQVQQVLAAADKAGVLREPQPHLAVRSLIWAVHAHAVTGLHGDIPADSRFALRAFVHRWLDRMYARP